eukprot:SAG31_NODE_2025_length_6642_cov_6.408681_6_plen_105_part_00
MSSGSTASIRSMPCSRNLAAASPAEPSSCEACTPAERLCVPAAAAVLQAARDTSSIGSIRPTTIGGAELQPGSAVADGGWVADLHTLDRWRAGSRAALANLNLN